jgi:hypothetical protein
MNAILVKNHHSSLHLIIILMAKRKRTNHGRQKLQRKLRIGHGYVPFVEVTILPF